MSELGEMALRQEFALREAADKAYQRARQLVFDDLPEDRPLTPEQTAVLVELEAAEAALKEFRRTMTAA